MTDAAPPRNEEPVGRRCRATRGRLDRLEPGSRWSARRWLTERHLRGCEACAEAWATGQRLADGLTAVVPAPLVDAEGEVSAGPPEGLLEGLLEQAADPGLRGRAAVPIRGAISGARPGLTVSLLLFAGLVGALAAYGTWRATRALRRDRR